MKPRKGWRKNKPRLPPPYDLDLKALHVRIYTKEEIKAYEEAKKAEMLKPPKNIKSI